MSKHTIPTELNIAPRGKSWLNGQLIDGVHGYPTRQSMENAERAAFEKWARFFGTWDVEQDDDPNFSTTGYTDITVNVAWLAWQARAALAATPAAVQTHAEAAAALGINSALTRIRAGNHAEAIEPLEHALRALADTPAADSPTGMKLVPMEPTAEMLERAGATDRDGTPATYKTLYMAMVGASPAAAPVVLPEPVSDEQIKAVFLANGFTIKEGLTDLKPYVYQAARALLATATGLPAQAVEPSDAELIALNAGECFFSESPSKYPELGHGTQYHGGAPGVIGFARAALALRADPAAYSQKFQQRVQPWMMACFGPEISADTRERNHRFLEEALELVQCLGCTASEAHQLVDYVYGRPWGEPAQEAGGVMVTLAALCLANGLDMQACGETELARIWTKVEAIRAKQAAKPKHSPLPEHAPQAQADARDALIPAKPVHPKGMTSINARLSFNMGWMACERHHGIRSEDVEQAVATDAAIAAQAAQGGEHAS